MLSQEIDYLSINNSSNNTSNDLPMCTLEPAYFEFERVYYLAIMCPIAIIGIFTNVVTFRLFSYKCFNTVTFRFLRLIAISDCFICIIVVPYCLTSYTPAFNESDMYFKNFYLAFIYLPVANLLITISMYLNLLVSLERLISVGE